MRRDSVISVTTVQMTVGAKQAGTEEQCRGIGGNVAFALLKTHFGPVETPTP